MPIKNNVLRLAVGSAAGMMLVAGNYTMAGVTGSPHDLSSGTGTGNAIYSTDQQEICVFCHTPHNALKGDSIPLWNHELSQETYGVYDSPTFDQGTTAGGDIAEIGDAGLTDATATVSNLCMSCHDGTIAINSFENDSNSYPTTTMVGTGTGDVLPTDSSANLGTNLADDHPVNFTYDSALAILDGSLKDPADLSDAKLFAGKVQCASCHDPHDTTNMAFLRASMDGSGLCKDCHTK